MRLIRTKVVAACTGQNRQAGTTGSDGIQFFTVRGDADGLTRTSLSTMDMTRKQAKLEFNNVAAKPLGTPATQIEE